MSQPPSTCSIDVLVSLSTFYITSNTRAISSWNAAQQEETGVHGVVKAVWAKVPLLCWGSLPVLPCSVWACCLKKILEFPPKNRNPSWMVGFYLLDDGRWGWGLETKLYFKSKSFYKTRSCVPFFAVGFPNEIFMQTPAIHRRLAMLFWPPIRWWIFGIVEISGVGILHGWGTSFRGNQQTKRGRMVQWEQERIKRSIINERIPFLK